MLNGARGECFKHEAEYRIRCRTEPEPSQPSKVPAFTAGVETQKADETLTPAAPTFRREVPASGRLQKWLKRSEAAAPSCRPSAALVTSSFLRHFEETSGDVREGGLERLNTAQVQILDRRLTAKG